MRVLDKTGFEKEAVLKRAVKKYGSVFDLIHYAIFK